MINLFDFCSVNPIFPWILSFFLGLGIGWLVWNRFKVMYYELKSKHQSLEFQNSNLENKIEACNKFKLESEAKNEILKAKIRELEVINSGVKGSVSAMQVHSTSNSIAPLSDREETDLYYASIGNGNLQIIEGIGPTMDSLLKLNNIINFSNLQSISKEELKAILNKFGDKYRMIDPASWPQQAKLANERNWSGLISFQKSLHAGRVDNLRGAVTESKLENFLIKEGLLKKFKPDDLKAIEGIGPKIEQLLHENGINTWYQLSNTPVQEIRDILKTAGHKFSLADPDTWPMQALLASEQKWDKFYKLQENLKTGKIRSEKKNQI